MIPEQFQVSFWWDELSLISAYTTFEILRKNPARHQIKMPTPGIICKKIVHQILDCSSYLYFQIKSAKRKTQLPEVRMFTTLLLTIVYIYLCFTGAKKKRLSWVEGYQLLEQFPSSGDYKYIDEKMHNTMEPAITGHLQYSGYEILNVSHAFPTRNLIS